MVSRRMSARQRGQALTEFLVVALALVPLFLLVPVIAKYQDIAHSSQLASRYAAFDATVNNDSTNGFKDADLLAQEVRRRFFSNIDAPIKSSDAPGNFKAHQNLFWRGPNDQPLIQDINAVAVAVESTNSTGDGVADAGKSIFGLPDTPLQRGRVSVPLANLPAGIRSYEPFDEINLNVSRETILLVDGWSARDLQAVDTYVARGASAVADALGSVEPVLSLPFMVFEMNKVDPPRIGDLSIWQDVVPGDRLRAE